MTTPTMELSTAQVAEVSGLSLRQLQWADERGHLKPQKRGHRRYYTAHSALQACILARLRGCGISHSRTLQILKAARDERLPSVMAATLSGRPELILASEVLRIERPIVMISIQSYQNKIDRLCSETSNR